MKGLQQIITANTQAAYKHLDGAFLTQLEAANRFRTISVDVVRVRLTTEKRDILAGVVMGIVKSLFEEGYIAPLKGRGQSEK